MNPLENPFTTAIIFTSIFLIAGALLVGSSLENSRLYKKCLQSNSSMIYIEVDKMCREFVK